MHRLLSTSEFAEALGLSESTVRRLADSGELSIHRTRGGHRKIPVGEAIRYVRKSGLPILRPDILGLLDAARAPGGDYAEKLLTALREGQAKAVIGLLQAMYAEGMTLAEICDGPIHHAMQAIGNAWPEDKRSIFVEHRATLLCVRALCQIRLALPDADEHAPTAMGAAPQDDPYLLPSLMVSVVLHECGFEETNLGPNTPVDVLVDSVEVEQPSLVWLAITNPVRSRLRHREIETLASAVAVYGGTLIIGGQSSATYVGPGADPCHSMKELSQRAAAIFAQGKA